MDISLQSTYEYFTDNFFIFFYLSYVSGISNRRYEKSNHYVFFIPCHVNSVNVMNLNVYRLVFFKVLPIVELS